jgi:hypothetical protein
MAPRKRRAARIQEYTLDDLAPPLETIYEHTEYSSSRRVQHSLLSLPTQAASTKVEPQRLPSLPPVDYNLEPEQSSTLPDGDMELVEMENCELEIAGMAISGDVNSQTGEEGSSKRRRTHSVRVLPFSWPLNLLNVIY